MLDGGDLEGRKKGRIHMACERELAGLPWGLPGEKKQSEMNLRPLV